MKEVWPVKLLRALQYYVRECGLQSSLTKETPTVATPTVTQVPTVPKGPTFEALMTQRGMISSYG